MKRWLALATLVVLAIVAATWYVLTHPPQQDPRDGQGGDGGTTSSGEPLADAERLELSRTALAETENLNPLQAIPLWQQLLASSPEDIDALQNLAIARVSLLPQLNDALNDGSRSAAEKERIRSELPERIAEARRSVDQFEQAIQAQDRPELQESELQESERQGSERQEIAEFLRASIDGVAQHLVPPDQQRAFLARTVQRLTERLRNHPQEIMLVGLIDDYAQLAQDPIEGPSASFSRSLVDALVPASQANPRNLMVALLAFEYALQAEDPRALQLAEHLKDLTETVNEVIGDEAQRLGLDAKALPAQLIQLVSERKFRQAYALFRPWFNLLNPTEIVKIDRRRAKPNVLDLVATKSIVDLASALSAANPPRMQTGPIALADPRALSTSVQDPSTLTAVDFDLTGNPEIAVAGSGTLAVVQRNEGEWLEIASTSVPAGIRGITVADLFIVDGSDPLRIKRTTGGRSPAPGAVDGAAADAGAAMRRHDVFPSLLVWGAEGIQIIRIDGRAETEPGQRLLPVDRPSGLEQIRNITALAPGDIDADGDLDLIIASEEEGVGIWINRGDMTFFSMTAFSKPPAELDPVVDFSIGDFDRDLDLDVVTIQQSGQVGWLENLLHLQMRWAPFEGAEEVAAGRGVAMLEWDGNVSWDVAYAGPESLAVLRTETTDAGIFRPIENTVTDLHSRIGEIDVQQLFANDLDNDSWTDLLAVGDHGLAVLAGGPERLDNLPVTALIDAPVTAAVPADFDGDGKTDVAFITDGQLRLALNQTSPAGHFVDVQMKGIYDNTSGRVNHFAIGSTLELRFGPHYRAMVIRDRTTRFGLGASESADTLRAILTNGITQNVIDPPIDATIVEEQTNKGSCPFLYTWDGEKFVFVSDCLWAAPLGLQVATGKLAPNRPWEYLKVDGRFLAPRDGRYEIRLTEELWELAYFDHVSLIAVDHPAEVEIWTNEKVGPPEVVQPRTFAFSDMRPVTSAVDTDGADCGGLLAAIDERYVQGFDRRIRQGLCPPHWIDLGLGEIREQDRVFLVLTGWIWPTDTSLNIQIDQNPLLDAVEPPSVWIPGADGEWVESIPAMGFPGGKTKTIVVELTGKLNAEDPRVRIQTTAQIYWDAASVVVNPPEVDVVSTPLELESAEVAYHGFSDLLPREPTQPHRYDYQRAGTEPKWPPLRGLLTRLGPCRDLLERWDNAMVVIGSGDEVRLTFRAPEAPLPEGWKRDFILHSVGWDKDADLNTLAGQSVEPMPFREMLDYPPPASQLEQSRAIDRLNASHRQRTQSFRSFWTR